MPKRTIDELVNREEPAWPIIQGWLKEATHNVEVLPVSDARRSEALVAVQVTTRSPMGAVVYETGGIFVDHGWVRVLGSGHPRMTRTLGSWNLGRSVMEEGVPPPFFLIGDDVMGGFFALDGGALGPGKHHVYYFAPDSLEWKETELKYGDWLYWLFTGDLKKYYETFRWPGWEKEVEPLSGDQVIHTYPPLFTKEGKDLLKVSRAPVPVSEAFDYQFDMRRQLADVKNGNSVDFKIGKDPNLPDEDSNS